MARLLESNRAEIKRSNKQDLDNARSEGLQKHLVDRLVFGDARISSRIKAL